MFRENSDNSRKQKDVDYTNGERRGGGKISLQLHGEKTVLKNGFVIRFDYSNWNGRFHTRTDSY